MNLLKILGKRKKPEQSGLQNESIRHNKLETDVGLVLGDRKTVVEEIQQNIWQYVSISKAQYEDHYSSLIRNATVYSQDKELIVRALSNARDGLAGTMLNRLPHDRPREETHQVEQLWKFAMFACYVIEELRTLERCFYDVENRVLESFNSRAYQWSEGGVLKSEWILTNSLNSLFSGVSIEWFSQDDGRALLEIMKCINGEKCFINEKKAMAGKSLRRTVAPEQKAEEKESDAEIPAKVVPMKNLPATPQSSDEALPTDSHEHPLVQSTASMETVVEFTPKKKQQIDKEILFRWAEAKGYIGEQDVFIPGLAACREFIKENDWNGSIRELQDAMFNFGAENETRKDEKGKRILGYVFKGEGK